MSATFLIRVHVPDAPSVAHDASLEIAGDDAVRYALGLDAELEGENRLEEMLGNGELDGACTLLMTALLLEKKQIVGSRKTVESQRLTAGQVHQQAAQ